MYMQGVNTHSPDYRLIITIQKELKNNPSNGPVLYSYFLYFVVVFTICLK